MKKIVKTVAMILCLVLSLSLFGCGGGSGKTPDGKTIIEFWGWGDDAEVQVFSDLVKRFNAQSKTAHVNFTKKPGSSYANDTLIQLGSRRPPDVFFVGDSDIKRWATLSKTPLLEDLTPYIEKSTKIDLDDIWEGQMQRFQFDPITFQNTQTAPIWGLPKDLGPTVIYYNEDAFKTAGVTVVKDKPIEQITEADEKFGFYEKGGKKYFNNSIPMDWEQLTTLGKLMTKAQTPSSPTDFGYFCNWWFPLGWSVGGDVLEFKENSDPSYRGGYWDFALGDKTKNYIVKEGKTITVSGTTYNAGEIVSSKDKSSLTLEQKSECTELPSMREAFDFFVSLSTNKDASGNIINSKISPKPSDNVDSTMFTGGKLAMYVEGRYMVPEFRRDCGFNWDVAPLPKHKDGIEAGHSGSMCLSMSSKSKNKDIAFELIEYISGAEGQEELLKTGFNVPNQKSLAYSDKFLVSDKPPYNNKVFLRSAETQRGGDWTFLPDDAWIELWAPTLNGDVLNGAMTVDKLFADYSNSVNEKLKGYTKIN